MKEINSKAVAILAVIAVCRIGFGATILDLDFAGVDGSENYDEATYEVTAMDSVDANLNLVEGLNFKSPSTVQGSGAAPYGTSYDLNVFGWGGASDLDNLILGNRYMSITIQAASGYQLNLDGANISLLGSRNGSGAPDTFYITATTTGTTGTSNQIGGSTSLPLTGPGNVYDINATFSGMEWNGLTGEVEIRFYGGGNTVSGNIHFSDMSITGATLTSVTPGDIGISSFLATPASVLVGETVTLSWGTYGADYIEIDQGIGDVTELSSTQIVVSADTTYTLTATNSFGNMTNASVTVTATPITWPPIINSFLASRTNLFAGETLTLAWDVDQADSLFIDQGIGDVTGRASIDVVPGADITYSLIANNSNGATTSSVSITTADLSLPVNLPNIVLIVADDVGFGDLSCYGAPSIYTPNLDQLARQGSRFTQFTTCGPGDLANQYALLTGRVARRGNLPASLNTGEAGGLDSREWTLAESLRKVGYETAFIGAWYLGDTPGSIATDQGFQLFYGLPHSGSPTPPLVENGTIIETPHNPNTLLDQLTGRASSFIAAQGSAPFLLVFQVPSLPASGPSLQGSYGNQIEALDGSVGQLLDSLESSNHTNTLVVFFSDEGPDLNASSYPIGSSGVFRDGTETTWEGAVRVPAIASWPGVIPPATENYAVFWLPDLFPSLRHITGAYTPGDRPYDGESHPAILLAAQTQPDDLRALYLHRHDGADYRLQAVRKGAWKYHIIADPYTDPRYPQPPSPLPTSPPFLFQLDVDPTEHIDRSVSHVATLAELQQEAVEFEATFGPTAAPQLPPANPVFIDPIPSIWISNEAAGAFNSTIIRPRDSLNDHYHIQHSTDLLSTWNDLPIDSYILSIIPEPAGEETLEISVPFSLPEFSGPLNFIRIKGERP